MSDLIRRQDAIDAIKKPHGGCYTEEAKGFAVYQVLSVPAIDAVEVVHGEWIEKWRFKPNGNPYHIIGDMECSVCHSNMLGRYYSRYCPHCGAKMEVEQNDEID